MPERRGRVNRGKHLAAGRLDVALQPLDVAQRNLVLLVVIGQPVGGLLPLLFGPRRSVAAIGDLQSLRFAPRLEHGQLRVELGDAAAKGRALLPIQLDLLLRALDVEFVRVRPVARGRGGAFGFGQFDTQAADVAVDLGQTPLRHRLALARIGQSGAGRFDGLRQVAEPAGKQHFLPAAQLVAKALVPSGLGRLTLQAAALLVDFEDDVVDAREVLLRGLELQLGGTPPGLVLRDAGGFLDQHAPVRGTRRQDEPDLALLDDGVGLGAQPGVHQELVDVPEPALGAVDQVLALARSIEPSHQLHVAARGPELGQHGFGRRQHLGGRLAVSVVAIAVGVTVAVSVPAAGHGRHAAEAKADFGSPGRLARVAAAEDDVFHLLAAQALGTLLAEHPRDRIGDVALAAPVGADNRRHPLVEGQFGAIGKGFEPGNLKAFEPHATPRYARTMSRSPVRPYGTGRAR